MDGIAPTNVTQIFCLRADDTCEMSSAEFDPKNRCSISEALLSMKSKPGEQTASQPSENTPAKLH